MHGGRIRDGDEVTWSRGHDFERGERDFVELCRDGGGWSLLSIAFVGFLVFVAFQE